MTGSKSTELAGSSFSKDLFVGKKVLITGASRGIGRACALAFAGLGAELALIAKNAEPLSTLGDEVNEIYQQSQSLKNSRTVLTKNVDVSSADLLKQTLREVKDRLGAIDILVNNAGIYITSPVDGHDLELWQKTMDTNLTSAMVASAFLVSDMVTNKWGRVVNISSMSGKSGEAFGSAYSASKFGLIGLTQSMALEVARHGVTVNAVCPGWVATDMAFEQINDPRWCGLNNIETEQSLDIARFSVPQERFIEASEVASLVVYLASDAARGITGQAINICGGLSVH